MGKLNDEAVKTVLNNIREGDPKIAELIKDCYKVLKERQCDGKTNFFEGGLIKQIEVLTSDIIEVRNRQTDGLVDAFQNLLSLRESNGWIQSEQEIYELITGVLFADLFGKEENAYMVLGNSVSSIMRLDYGKELPAISIDGTKDNIFNQFGLNLHSIGETLSDITISKKSINAFFEIQGDVLIFVTDSDFKIRSTNSVSDTLYPDYSGSLKGKHLFTVVPELGEFEDGCIRLDRIQNELIAINLPDKGLRKVEMNFVKCESEDEVTEFLFALDFNLASGSVEKKLHESYTLVNNVIRGLHEFRSELYGRKALETTSNLLLNLYQLREKSKSELLGNDQEVNAAKSFNEYVDFNLLKRHLSNEIKYLPGIEKLTLSVENKIVRPVYYDYELLFSVVKNLVVNSIKFGDIRNENIIVNVIFNEVNSGFEIIVEDNGIGIKEEFLNKIFERGYKINSDSDDLGFGLHFVKKNVVYLGGNIKVKSQPSVGSTFTVQLPF